MERSADSPRLAGNPDDQDGARSGVRNARRGEYRPGERAVFFQPVRYPAVSAARDKRFGWLRGCGSTARRAGLGLDGLDRYLLSHLALYRYVHTYRLETQA